MRRCHQDIARRHDPDRVRAENVHCGTANLAGHGDLEDARFYVTPLVACVKPEYAPFGVLVDTAQDQYNAQKCKACGEFSTCNFCRYTWTCCEDQGTKTMTNSRKDHGCKEIQVCGNCDRETNTPGCIAFCTECRRLRSERDFPQNGCAPVKRAHAPEREVD